MSGRFAADYELGSRPIWVSARVVADHDKVAPKSLAFACLHRNTHASHALQPTWRYLVIGSIHSCCTARAGHLRLSYFKRFVRRSTCSATEALRMTVVNKLYVGFGLARAYMQWLVTQCSRKLKRKKHTFGWSPEEVRINRTTMHIIGCCCCCCYSFAA